MKRQHHAVLPLLCLTGTLLQAEGADFTWVPASAYASLCKLFGKTPGQDPLCRKAVVDEETGSIRIQAYPQLCRLRFATARNFGQPLDATVEVLLPRSQSISDFKQWAVKVATEGGSPLVAKGPLDCFRVWIRNEAPAELVTDGIVPPPEPYRLIDETASALDAVCGNDRCTEVLLERFGQSSWPRGALVQPGAISPLDAEVEAASLTARAAAGDAHKDPGGSRAAWLSSLTVGSRLDCCDVDGQWFESEIVAPVKDAGRTKDRAGFRVHFRAWLSRFDEVLPADSPRLQPAGTMLPNFREFKIGQAVQVRVTTEDGSIWWDATVTAVTATTVTLVPDSSSTLGPLVRDRDDPAVCAAGVHALKVNRKATPAVVAAGVWELPAPQPAAPGGDRGAAVAGTGAGTGNGTGPARGPATGSATAAVGNGAALPADAGRAGRGGAAEGVATAEYGLVPFVRGIDDSRQARSGAGAVGLRNLGNTCFMNSMLQCLSNTEPLTRYFLARDRWSKEVNRDNPLGFGGRLAQAYAELMEDMWLGASSSVAPSRVKDVVSRHAPQFRGYQQHDSQELMSYLLDGLHEDCNRVRVKVATEKVESDGRPDAAVAATAWEVHRERNRSHVQDVIGGQLRSHIQCNNCMHVSLTFDPFTSLSVPVPVPERVKRVCTAVPHGPGLPIRPTLWPRIELTYLEFEIALRNDPGTFRDDPKSGFTTPAALDAVATHGPATPAARASFAWAKVANADNRHNRVLQWVHPDEPMRNVDDEDFVFAFFLPGRSAEQWKIDIQSASVLAAASAATALPADDGAAAASEPASASASSAAAPAGSAPLAGTGAEAAGSAGVPTRVRHPCGALVVSMTTYKGGAELSYDFPHVVYLPFVQALQDSDWDHDAAVAAALKSDAAPTQRSVLRAVWEQCQRHTSPAQLTADPTLSAENPPYTCYLVPAAAEPVSGDSADPRNKEESRGVFVQGDDSRVLVVRPDSDEPFPVSGDACGEWVLRLHWRPYGPSDSRKVGSQSKGEYGAESVSYARRSYGGVEGKSSGAISLGDCMESFVLREQLGKDDKWYCPKCKDHVRAYKKFDLFNVGEVLIVHLKRFRYSRVTTSSYWGASAVREKIGELVDFPVAGLDLSRYIMGKQPGPHIYDLYAVSEHSGGLGGGHYTATARNWINGRWYDFNDSFVREARSARDAVSTAAYVLFFRRRGGAPLPVPLPRMVRADGELDDSHELVAEAKAKAEAVAAALTAGTR